MLACDHATAATCTALAFVGIGPAYGGREEPMQLIAEAGHGTAPWPTSGPIGRHMRPSPPQCRGLQREDGPIPIRTISALSGLVPAGGLMVSVVLIRDPLQVTLAQRLSGSSTAG